MTLKAEWIDRGREPSCPPDPRFPNGVHVNLAPGRVATCFLELDYPARRIGAWVVECSRCAANAMVTTAGRPDDPRSVRLACKDRQR